jgi:hypothetical protein
MTDSQIELPVTDGHVHVQLLNGGSMVAEYHKLHKGEPAENFRMYNWAFFIYHAGYGRKIIWDLGMSSVRVLPCSLPLKPSAMGKPVYLLAEGPR